MNREIMRRTRGELFHRGVEACGTKQTRLQEEKGETGGQNRERER